MPKLPPLLPTPDRYISSEGSFRLSVDLPIVLQPGATESHYRAAQALQDAVFDESHLLLPIEAHARTEDLGRHIDLRVEASAKGDASPESYRMEVGPERTLVSGGGAPGLRYGLETLSQLVRGRRVPCCRVEDAPDLPKRGLLVDISRDKVPTLATLKQIVDDMVRVKLNVLMLYTEHVFRFRRHPLIGRGASPMSARELSQLDAYAAERHVELVPTLQSLGHMHHLLGIKRYRHLAESERNWSVSPALEETYELLADLYDEYLPNFRSPWFNANCDEPVDLGKGKSREWAERDGPAAVFAAHVVRVERLATERGKRTMIWADVVYDHPEVLDLLPDDILLIDWWYEANHDFDRVRLLAERDRPFMVAAGTTSWNTLFPRGANAVANIRGYADAVKRHGGSGFIVTDWGDGGHPNLFGNSSHAIAWGAQCAWGRTDIDSGSFDRAFSQRYFGDRSGKTGRIYRRLGAIHETGFEHFNHSPLKSLYFDDWTEAVFTRKADRKTLLRTRERLRKVRDEVLRARALLATRPAAAAELRFAVHVSLDAAEKGLLGLKYLELDEDKATKRTRSALARRVAALLERQSRAEDEHWELWLARNRPSSFDKTRSYYEASIRGLRRALRRLNR